MNLSLDSLRNDAVNIFQAGITAADPYQAVKKHLSWENDNLVIALDSNDDSKKRSVNSNKIHIIAFGKAACSMAQAATEIVPATHLANTPLAVTNYDNEKALDNIKVIAAGHPIPDLSGLQAAKQITQQLIHTKVDEMVLVLISGGGSALIPYPAEGITLEDKQATTDLLLASGASINQINAVRKHLSRLKGGQLAKLAAPAELHALILSDVLGDELSAIASGPTVADNSTFADAINILKSKNIWNKAPLAVQTLLEKGQQGEINETPKFDDPCFETTAQTLIGSNSISVNAINKAAKSLNYVTEIFSSNLSGEASEVAEQLVLHAKKQLTDGLSKPTAILAGGETTVTIKGTGKGGRNQEMALAFAIAAENHELKGSWTFLSGGTDGRDGPTDAAGGIVDSDSIRRLKNKKISPEQKLTNNDSYSALKESKDLVMTGATGTNVADLQVLLIQAE